MLKSLLHKKNLWKLGLLLLMLLIGALGIPWLTYERQPLPRRSPP